MGSREDCSWGENPVKKGKRLTGLSTGLSFREEKIDFEIRAQTDFRDEKKYGYFDKEKCIPMSPW